MKNLNEKPKKDQGYKYITYSQLAEGRREGLLKLLEEYGKVYILSDKTPPIKITFAKFE